MQEYNKVKLARRYANKVTCQECKVCNKDQLGLVRNGFPNSSNNRLCSSNSQQSKGVQRMVVCLVLVVRTCPVD